MSLPNVNISLANGQLGTIAASADAVAGLVLTGAAEGSISINTPIMINSLQQATNLGLTTTNNAFAYKQIKEFYDEAPIGTNLYVMLAPPTQKVHQLADKTNANGAIKLLNYAAGSIRLLGVLCDDLQVYGPLFQAANANGINADCYTAIANMQVLATQFFTAQTPFRAIIGGSSFNGNAIALNNMTQSSYNRVACLIGDTQSGASAAVGLLLGNLCALPVQRKVSRVKNGGISSPTAYIGSSAAEQYSNPDMLYDKSFISFRTFPGKSGYYFNSDTMCCSKTNDYASLARGRVIDKAQRIAYDLFVNEVDNEVLINSDGTLDSGYTKNLEQSITNQLNLSMTATNQISAVQAFIDPAQNVLATNIINVVLKITPVGYSSFILIQLGFNNPANA
jgi:Protein of unknown function (DUF2586)